MRSLDVGKIEFRRTGSGTLDVTLEDGTTVENVHCVRLFPFSAPRDYISVARRAKGELQEIGIIKRFRELPAAQQRLVDEDIRFRYFIPDILDIKRIRRSHGSWELDVVTDRGERSFLLRDRRENVSVRPDGSVIMTDVENCRFMVAGRDALPARARVELEKFLL